MNLPRKRWAGAGCSTTNTPLGLVFEHMLLLHADRPGMSTKLPGFWPDGLDGWLTAWREADEQLLFAKEVREVEWDEPRNSTGVKLEKREFTSQMLFNRGTQTRDELSRDLGGLEGTLKKLKLSRAIKNRSIVLLLWMGTFLWMPFKPFSYSIHPKTFPPFFCFLKMTFWTPRQQKNTQLLFMLQYWQKL